MKIESHQLLLAVAVIGVIVFYYKAKKIENARIAATKAGGYG